MQNVQNVSDWILLIIRVALGIIFLAHGSQKLFGMFGGSGIEGVRQMFANLGFVAPGFWAWILALGETLSGFFLVLGILPRLSAGIIAVVMIVAIAKVHAPNGFFMANKGFEYQFLILINCLVIILGGAGCFSLFNKC